jgi:hypothetical protein
MENNIQMELKEICYDGVDCILVNEDRVHSPVILNMVFKIWAP